jgi:hypothetical protein
LKQPSSTDILPAKSVKLSKGTLHHAVASMTMTRVMPVTHVPEVLGGAGGAKGIGRRQHCTTLPGVKAAPSAKNRIISAIRAMASLSSDGSEGSSLHDPVPEVQSKVNPHSPLVEPQVWSATTSRP